MVLPGVVPLPVSSPITPCVLVVEDNVLLRYTVAAELRCKGLQVVEAANADEAWTYLATGAPVALLFSDIRMPGSMDGVELARRAKAQNPVLDIILTSGSEQPDLDPRLGRFFEKPFSTRMVVSVILEKLGSTVR